MASIKHLLAALVIAVLMIAPVAAQTTSDNDDDTDTSTDDSGTITEDTNDTTSTVSTESVDPSITNADLTITDVDTVIDNAETVEDIQAVQYELLFASLGINDMILIEGFRAGRYTVEDMNAMAIDAINTLNNAELTAVSENIEQTLDDHEALAEAQEDFIDENGSTINSATAVDDMDNTDSSDVTGGGVATSDDTVDTTDDAPFVDWNGNNTSSNMSTIEGVSDEPSISNNTSNNTVDTVDTTTADVTTSDDVTTIY